MNHRQRLGVIVVIRVHADGFGLHVGWLRELRGVVGIVDELAAHEAVDVDARL